MTHMGTATELPPRAVCDPQWAPTAGTLANWLVSAPCCDVSGSPMLLALLRAWQRQPYRQANYSAFHDALVEAGAPSDVLHTVDELFAWAGKLGDRFCHPAIVYPMRGGRLPTRTMRMAFIRRYWLPALEAAFGPEPEIPF